MFQRVCLPCYSEATENMGVKERVCLFEYSELNQKIYEIKSLESKAYFVFLKKSGNLHIGEYALCNRKSHMHAGPISTNFSCVLYFINVYVYCLG